MVDMKYCEVCGILISTPEDDYYKHIRIKYCTACAADVNREKDARRHREYRRRTKKTYKLTEEKNRLLSEEVELLKREVQRLREKDEYNTKKQEMGRNAKKPIPTVHR